MLNSVNTPQKLSGVRCTPSALPVNSEPAASLVPINSHTSQQPRDSVQSQSLGAAKSVRGHRCEIENDTRPTEDKAGPGTVPPTRPNGGARERV